ncbi:hypothetical protein GAMM_250038 [Gammaproteobacteria bacterium]
MELASSLIGIIPIITVEQAIYRVAEIRVPNNVASGMLRPGLSTESAGTAADSTPIKAHKVKVAACEKADMSELPVTLKLLVM